MLMKKRRIIEVIADWVDLCGPTAMGHLTATLDRLHLKVNLPASQKRFDLRVVSP